MKRFYIRRYVILDSFVSGLRIISYKEYMQNPILQCHDVVAMGTKRQLKKMGWIR